MKTILSAVLLCGALTFQPAVSQDSSVPVIFVHGFLGFGEDELFGFQYWPYASEFQAEGFTTHAASVGPVSSNWDRACELYAQIKGTRVDYGAAHSAEAGHLRDGKDYTGIGFYPSWSPSNPVHLVGHSMGGQTIRMLEILLREGDKDERDASGPNSELFDGGNTMIKSITTFSAPHDGTQLVGILGPGFVNVIRNIIVLFAGLVDESLVEQVYDFDLDHWGVSRAPGESPNDYWTRLESTVLRDDVVDLAPFDLSPAGALVQNNRGQQAYPDTHYFSFASEDTFGLYQCFWFLRCGVVQYAEVTMNLLLHPFAASLGSIDQDEDQRKNDGVVNWQNQLCPTLGYKNGAGNCEEFSGTWNPGKWYYMDVNYLDHLGTTLRDWVRDNVNYGRSAKKLYRDHALRIKALDVPSFTPAPRPATLDPGNAQASLGVLEEPSVAGAIVLVSVGLILAGFMVALLVRVRKLRRVSGAAEARTPSFLTATPKLSFSSRSRKGSSPPSRKGSSPQPYSTPNMRNNSYTGSQRNYSQSVEEINL